MICPQLASPSDLASVGRYIVDDDWVLEQKLDGHRIMLVGPGMPGVAAITRNGTSYTRKLPTPVQRFRLPDGVDASNLILDGELVGNEYWVFDMLTADGSLDDRVLQDRRVILETFLLMWKTPYRLVPQARTTQEKENLLTRAAREHLEGVVAKRVDSLYRYGQRPASWVKVKFVQTADVVVTGVRDDGKDSARVGIYRNGSLIEVGRLSLIGKPEVAVNDVIEVRYLYVADGVNPRLYQPTLIHVRDDKSPEECTDDQLKVTNKAVLQAL